MSIPSVLRMYESALNTNDVEAILSLYGDHPVFIPQNAPALIGRDAVREGYEKVFSAIKLAVEFEIHEIELVDDWAWVRTSSAGHSRIRSLGLEVLEGNNELFVFRREHGAWKIHRYIFATSQPRTS